MKAIALLKFFRNKKGTIYRTMIKVDEAIEELENLQNRSCFTCKYGHTYHFDKDIECMKLGAETQGIYFKKDFYCKNWELKNEKI